MKRNVRVRVRESTAASLKTLQESTGLSHSRFVRSVLLDKPVLSAGNLRLWQKLARTKANLTQLERLLAGLSPSPLLDQVLQALELAQEDLRVVRRRLLGLEAER